MLDFLRHWCSQNKTSVNIIKNKSFIFVKFNIGDSTLERCHKYKYIGVDESFFRFYRNNKCIE